MIKKQPEVIGWREWVGLPAFGIGAIKAKVDTGARTSALHAYYVTPFEKDGKPWVRFGLHPLQKDSLTCIECEAPVKDVRMVTDSGGHKEERVVIDTTLSINGMTFSMEVTLTDRENMRFRMLLGRSALKQGFLVDSGKSFLLGGNKNHPPIASM
ncbi:ATP-dependent zinc protease [Cellvibrio sp. pealriver]|uniref:ATP-dependent zinc protease family protein n=1 Tax=Cellvibrio sp. pealriver TaxID=1622269 RepID=UPI0009E3AB81|nr:ATP-dependent zinc protease [Cellvibrio sp. pealriver]